MLYLRSFNLIVSTQSGFRSHHSTESILIKMTDDWLEAMDQGLYTGAIFLDLRKAFDVVNHDLLIAKLQIYGCSPSSLLWFKSYLTDRRQCVKLTNQRLLHDGAVGSPYGPAPSSCSILNLRFTVKTTTIMRDRQIFSRFLKFVFIF